MLLNQAMARILLLDSTPLGLLCRRRGHPHGDACRHWLDSIELAGIVVVVPEIADYEVRRELIRVGVGGGLVRLDNLLAASQYDPITTPLMHGLPSFGRI